MNESEKINNKKTILINPINNDKNIGNNNIKKRMILYAQNVKNYA